MTETEKLEVFDMIQSGSLNRAGFLRILERIQLDEWEAGRAYGWEECGQGSDDGQPDEAQEWHDFDPDC